MPAEGLQQDQAGAEVDADVGDVEDRPVRQHQEVDDVTAERAGIAEEPVGQVAGDAGEQGTEGDRPGGAAEAPAQPQHDDRPR